MTLRRVYVTALLERPIAGERLIRIELLQLLVVLTLQLL